MNTFPRYNLVFSDSSLTTVERLIATDGPGQGFYLVEDPATVQQVARQFAEVAR